METGPNQLPLNESHPLAIMDPAEQVAQVCDCQTEDHKRAALSDASALLGVLSFLLAIFK